MTRTELLEHYLKPTDLTVKELFDRNAFAQIMQFAEAYHLEQLRIGGVSQQRELLKAFDNWCDKNEGELSSSQDVYIDKFLNSL